MWVNVRKRRETSRGEGQCVGQEWNKKDGEGRSRVGREDSWI